MTPGSTGPREWCGSSFLVFVGAGSGRQVTAESFVAWCQAVVNADAQGQVRSRWRVRRRAWAVRRAGRWYSFMRIVSGLVDFPRNAVTDRPPLVHHPGAAPLSLDPPPHDRNCAVVYSLDRPPLPSGYRDHELAVGLDKVAQVGVLALAEDGNFASKGSMDRGVVEYMLLGHSREFMAGSEIPIELVRQAVKEFLGNGGLIPTCIEWQEEEF